MSMPEPRTALVLKSGGAWYAEENCDTVLMRYSDAITKGEMLEFTTVSYEGDKAVMWMRPDEVLAIQEVTEERWQFALNEYAREREKTNGEGL